MFKIFDTYREQLGFLNHFNDFYYPVLLMNKENHIVHTSKDGTLDRVFKYDNNNYLEFEKQYTNNDFHVIPSDVNSINTYMPWSEDIYNSKNAKKEKLYKQVFGEPLYKIGLISDIHYNDTDESDTNPDTIGNDDGSEYSEDLINAFNFFKDNNVDFISCSGDISTDLSAHLKNYQLCINKYIPNIPIFTCSGNHDTRPKYKYHDLWKSISAINPNDEYEITYFKDYEQYSYKGEGDEEYDLSHTEENGNGTSFYIKKYYNDTFDVYIYLNVEYGWNNRDNYETHNCRLLTQEELLVHEEVDTDNDLHLYHPQTLRCLAEILETYKDHRCFIFTHLMFPNKAGNYHRNNNQFYYEYAKYSNHADVLRGDQGEYIRNLMEIYDNNYWFCGHSHYKWCWEKADHNINITKTNNSYNIHLPSLSRPLPYGITSYKTAVKDSEAAIMEIYPNYVVIKGIVFKEEDPQVYNNLYLFPDDDMQYVTANMFTWTNNEYSIEQLDDDYIQINFKYLSSNNDIYLNTGLINGANFGNYIPILRFDDVMIWFDEMYNYYSIDENSLDEYEKENFIRYRVTQDILNERKLGFRDNTTNTNKWYYYFESNHIYTLYNNGVIFKISSDSQYKNFNFHIKLKMQIGFKYIGYINKFLPIACFKLPNNKK